MSCHGICMCDLCIAVRLLTCSTPKVELECATVAICLLYMFSSQLWQYGVIWYMEKVTHAYRDHTYIYYTSMHTFEWIGNLCVWSVHALHCTATCSCFCMYSPQLEIFWNPWTVNWPLPLVFNRKWGKKRCVIELGLIYNQYHDCHPVKPYRRNMWMTSLCDRVLHYVSASFDWLPTSVEALPHREVTLVLFSFPCMHVSLLYQARSLVDQLQLQEAANH